MTRPVNSGARVTRATSPSAGTDGSRTLPQKRPPKKRHWGRVPCGGQGSPRRRSAAARPHLSSALRLCRRGPPGSRPVTAAPFRPGPPSGRSRATEPSAPTRAEDRPRIPVTAQDLMTQRGREKHVMHFAGGQNIGVIPKSRVTPAAGRSRSPRPAGRPPGRAGRSLGPPPRSPAPRGGSGR